MQTSANPAFGDKAVKRAKKDMSSVGVMTINGTLAKTFLLFALFSGAALFAWISLSNDASYIWPMMIGASAIALVTAIVIMFKSPSPLLSTIYSLAQGVAIGAISYNYADAYDGIVAQAVLLTVGITLGMYLSYATGFIKVTEKFKSIIIIGTLGIMFYYLIVFLLSLFGVNMTSLFSGTTGIVIGAVIVIIAALNYLLDFSFIEESVKSKAPKQFEWYGAFGLMVTFIWLYISVLQMLGASRR